MCECCDEGRCAGGCRYLMEVGSTRLPLKGIVDDTIGQRLQYEAANQRELSPLFAAIQKNSSLRLLAVSKMQSADVLEVRRPSPPPLPRPPARHAHAVHHPPPLHATVPSGARRSHVPVARAPAGVVFCCLNGLEARHGSQARSTCALRPAQRVRRLHGGECRHPAMGDIHPAMGDMPQRSGCSR